VSELLRIAAALALKDLKVEFRSRTAITSALVFATLVLVVGYFARDPALVSKEAIAPSMLWVTVAFAGLIALNRSFAMERESHAIDGLLMAPVSRSAIFLGKFAANLTFVALVDAVTLPLFVLFYNIPITTQLGGVWILLFLASAGLVAVGTVLSAVAVRTRFAELVLPVLVLPFLVPPIIAGAEATARLLASRPASEIMGWFRFLVVYDIVFFTVGLMVFPSLLDE
jgi:heme exporter protein B